MTIPTLKPPLRQAAVDSYAVALRVVFLFQVAINLLVFIACLPIQENALPYVSIFFEYVVTDTRVQWNSSRTGADRS